MRQYITVFLLIITVMPAYSQLPFSAYGNCTENTHGFINIESEVRNIPAVYCDATPFSEGLAAVKKGNKWGFIDADNHPVIAFQYDGARSFRGGLSIVRQDEFYGVINRQGAWVIRPQYYDLMPYELDGKRYFISRDSSFFQGIIDLDGNTILSHRYTYVMTLEPNITTGQRFYHNIPFYTVFREIDTANGSFYEQFEADAFAFAPEKGLHAIYDLQFNRLTSVPSTGPADGFQHDQLLRIDAYLAENGDKNPTEKAEAIDSLLALPNPDAAPQATNPVHTGTWRMTDDEVGHYLDSLGYCFFTEDGKTGLKKGNDVLIPAQHTALKPVTAVVVPLEEDLLVLKTHYGGRYRDAEKRVFDMVAIISHEGDPDEAAIQYSLSGAIALPVRQTNTHNTAILSSVTPLGFLYLHITVDTAGKPIKTYRLVDWLGDELLPPIYRKIEVVKAGCLLITQENPVKNGVEEHFGLFDQRGRTIIPIGVYSDIRPFTQQGAENLYLAMWSDPYPTVAEKKETEQANKTYVILKVEGRRTRVVNTFTAAGQVYPSGLDAETGMLLYRLNNEAHDQQMDN